MPDETKRTNEEIQKDLDVVFEYVDVSTSHITVDATIYPHEVDTVCKLLQEWKVLNG